MHTFECTSYSNSYLSTGIATFLILLFSVSNVVSKQIFMFVKNDVQFFTQAYLTYSTRQIRLTSVKPPSTLALQLLYAFIHVSNNLVLRWITTDQPAKKRYLFFMKR